MTARDWLAKRAELEAVATEGPWEFQPWSKYTLPSGDYAESILLANASPDGEIVRELSDADGAWIADARSSAPAMRKALEAVVASETRYVRLPLTVELSAPSYSCDPCKRGEHEKCPGRVYDISWQFDCTCHDLVPHFEVVECHLVPVAAITAALEPTP